MAELNKMYINLKKDDLPKALLPQVVMVSVDPKRDSVARLHGYVTEFNPSFIGARGSMAHLLTLSKQMHVVFSKIQSNDGNKNHYTITHSAEITLIDPKGQVRASFSYPHKAHEMTDDYIKLMRVYG